MRILSPAFHTSYQYNLASAMPDHEWTFYLGLWSGNRPCPLNVRHTEVGPKDSFDVALAHSPSQFYGISRNIAEAGADIPIIYVCHVGLVDDYVAHGIDGRTYEQFLDDIEGCVVVCVSYFMTSQWRFRSRKLVSVIPHYIPEEIVGDPVWVGGGGYVVNVVNDFYQPKRGTGAEHWDALGVERKLYGSDNGEKGSGKLATIDDFRGAMRDPSAFLWCADNVAMSFAPLEAMAMGVPIVAPRTADWPILVTDQVTGLLYDYGDIDQCEAACRRLMDDGAFARRMARNGGERVRKIFNREAFRRGWQAALEAAVSG